jgi:alpha-L-fucosidase
MIAVRNVSSVLLVLFALGWDTWAESGATSPAPDIEGETRMTWWREARFGLFIHWGPVSLEGTEIGWSRGGERRGLSVEAGPGSIPVEVYDNLYKRFNPTAFDAKAWVALAQAAGMKYLVFTTKHHDGFCMFDSARTDYKITLSPFGRDVVQELAAACHEAGLKLGFYYSPPDWHHPDYETVNHERYIDYLHGQLRELCSNYGQVDIIWFDGLSGTAEDWDAERLMAMIRALQPQVVINNRAGLPEDFDTPEQTIGAFQRERPWESCITLCNQWAWKPGDAMKTLRECLHTLIRCAGGDGNLLLNVGPMPTGAIEPRQAERLREIGAWLAKYGETIYGTRGGPYKPGEWGASTCRGNTVYLHLLDSEAAMVVLPPLPCKVVRSYALTGGSVSVGNTKTGLAIEIAKGNLDPIDTLVALELDTIAEHLEPISIPSGSLALNGQATASNVFASMEDYGADKAFDDDESTRWATDAGTREAWLEVDFGAPQKFGRVTIDEACGMRIQRFALQRRQGHTWETFYTGTTIGPKWSVEFEPMTAQALRLHILEASEGPTVFEFRVFPGR